MAAKKLPLNPLAGLIAEDPNSPLLAKYKGLAAQQNALDSYNTSGAGSATVTPEGMIIGTDRGIGSGTNIGPIQIKPQGELSLPMLSMPSRDIAAPAAPSGKPKFKMANPEPEEEEKYKPFQRWLGLSRQNYQVGDKDFPVWAESENSTRPPVNEEAFRAYLEAKYPNRAKTPSKVVPRQLDKENPLPSPGDIEIADTKKKGTPANLSALAIIAAGLGGLANAGVYRKPSQELMKQGMDTAETLDTRYREKFGDKEGGEYDPNSDVSALYGQYIQNVLPGFDTTGKSAAQLRKAIPALDRIVQSDLTRQKLTMEQAAAQAKAAQAERDYQLKLQNAANDEERNKIMNDYYRAKTAAAQKEGGPGALKPLSEAQGKALGFYEKGQQAGNELDALAAKGHSPSRLSAITPNELMSPDDQKFQSAKQTFIDTILRDESGAAISPSEFEKQVKESIPEPGDKPEVLAQKAKVRKTLIEARRVRMGMTDEEYKQRRIQAGLSPNADLGAGVKYKAPAADDYAGLPEGVTGIGVEDRNGRKIITGSDGKTYIKGSDGSMFVMQNMKPVPIGRK